MPESRPQPRSIFELVAREHRDLEAGFGRLHAAPDLAGAQARWPALASALQAHLAAEHAVLHPRLEAIAGLAAELVALDGAHATLDATLTALRSPTITGGEWLRALRRLEDALGQHVGLLESVLFPVARRAIPLREAGALGDRYTRARDAPTPVAAGPPRA